MAQPLLATQVQTPDIMGNYYKGTQMRGQLDKMAQQQEELARQQESRSALGDYMNQSYGQNADPALQRLISADPAAVQGYLSGEAQLRKQQAEATGAEQKVATEFAGNVIKTMDNLSEEDRSAVWNSLGAEARRLNIKLPAYITEGGDAYNKQKYQQLKNTYGEVQKFNLEKANQDALYKQSLGIQLTQEDIAAINTTKALAEQGAVAPKGYRKTEVGLEPIPGGEAATKVADVERAKKAAKSRTKIQSGVVIGKVDDALDLIEKSSTGSFSDANLGIDPTGLFGGITSFIPGTDAYNIEKTIDTIKSNLGFDQLQLLRDASPTGGALGAISERELTALQSTISSLDIGQDTDQLKENLQQIKTHYNNILKNIELASLPQVNSQQEYDALPKGAKFADEGKVFTKD